MKWENLSEDEMDELNVKWIWDMKWEKYRISRWNGKLKNVWKLNFVVMVNMNCEMKWEYEMWNTITWIWNNENEMW